MVIVETILTGIISGIVASFCYALFKRMIRPKIRIVDKVIHDEANGIFIVKIINRSRIRITDVDCSLRYYKYLTNGYKTRDLDSPRKISSTIDKYVNDKNEMGAPSLYAVQYGFLVPDEVIFDKKDKLVFSVRGVHPFSGTVAYFTQEYTFDDESVLKNMCYDAGDNVGVHEMSK